jgi:hypothetical protein
MGRRALIALTRGEIVTDQIDLTADRVITLPVSPEEDALLRRLAQFERLGATLAPTMLLLKNEIRTRDRRSEIREPGEQWVAS